MAILLNAESMFELPLSNPVLIFSLVLFIILFVPLLLNRIKVPYVIGLILAGVAVGEHGANLLRRDSSIVLFGTVGLIYIMFLAALEIDMKEFKKNSSKSLIFGVFTFAVPMLIAAPAARFLLGFSWISSILFASMLASHTLISYPVAARFNVHKTKAAIIAVGGTIITDILSLLVLAVIAKMSQGEINQAFWIQLIVSVIVFALIVWFVFPIIARWFFKHFDDSIAQYTFVLAMVFLGSFLAELAGIEPIIGAFLSGLALNRLIPHHSPLMNRIDFVGNALFIPFFLIGVGMLVDIQVLFKSAESLKVAGIMTVAALVSKWLAALLTQKSFKMNGDERTLIFGLSAARAAATLATVLVGYNIIIGQNELGEPIRLLNEDVLNGCLIMILITCTIASIETSRAAVKIAKKLNEGANKAAGQGTRNILIAASKEDTIDPMIELALLMQPRKHEQNIFVLSVISSETVDRESEERRLRKYQDRMVTTAAATDVIVSPLIRYDVSYASGIQHTLEEKRIHEVIIGQQKGEKDPGSVTGLKSQKLLARCPQIVYLIHGMQPLNTIGKITVVCSDRVELEASFPMLIERISTIGKQLNCDVHYYSSEGTLASIQAYNQANKGPGAKFTLFDDWSDFLILSRDVRTEDLFVVICARPGNISYHDALAEVPRHLAKYFNEYNYLLMYPDLQADFSIQTGQTERTGEILQKGINQISKTGDKLIRNILKPGN
ncbi:cation:proton antiporter [Dyadobacter sp. CY107]|uniref:cation:proton antiporter n=1 Tax=Dyadobacter fanqingshengii TaxID=2906443 RepID=UPI001F4489F4|nr:cation:proton antiporter [Dyadobacter fanqingshengii]MCF2504730.1 cation:proton antiporter [Dyadobacter fanqingshengii]